MKTACSEGEDHLQLQEQWKEWRTVLFAFLMGRLLFSWELLILLTPHYFPAENVTRG